MGRTRWTTFARNRDDIDLILTDVVLPDFDGRVLSNEARRELPSVRVLFTSGYSEDLVAHHGVLDSGIHYIEKPYSVHALSRKIRQVLEED